MRVCGRSCETGEVVTLTLATGRITHIQAGAEAADLGSSDLLLSAGFCDLQVNGYNGRDFNAGIWGTGETSPHELVSLLDDLAQAGTALFCPTLVTQSFAAICTRLKVIADILETHTRWARAVPGIHLEGPYLSSECVEKVLFRQSPYHDMDHGDVNHGFAAFGQELIILAQSPIPR